MRTVRGVFKVTSCLLSHVDSIWFWLLTRVCFFSGKSSQWKGTVLDQVPVNPSLYLIKYDGFDCVYGLELYSDERVVGLEVLPDRVGEKPPPQSLLGQNQNRCLMVKY